MTKSVNNNNKVSKVSTSRVPSKSKVPISQVLGDTQEIAQQRIRNRQTGPSFSPLPRTPAQSHSFPLDTNGEIPVFSIPNTRTHYQSSTLDTYGEFQFSPNPNTLTQQHNLNSNVTLMVQGDNYISRALLSQQRLDNQGSELHVPPLAKLHIQDPNILSNTRPMVQVDRFMSRALQSQQMLGNQEREFHVSPLPNTRILHHSLLSNTSPTVQSDNFLSRAILAHPSLENRERECHLSPIPNTFTQHQRLISNTPPTVSVDNYISKKRPDRQKRQKRGNEDHVPHPAISTDNEIPLRSKRRRLLLNSDSITSTQPQVLLLNTLGKRVVSQRRKKEVQRFSLGEMNVECQHCHALHWKAEKLAGSGLAKFGKCCFQGKIKLPELRSPPAELKELYDGCSELSLSFRNHTRQYNSAYAFTSLGVTLQERVTGKGPSTFIIHGELRHRTGSLIPQTDQTPVYSQLYIFDPKDALAARTERNNKLNKDVLRIIQDCLIRNNPFPEKFVQAKDVLSKEGNVCQNIPASLHYSSATDKRRYNLPTADEVAVIIPGDGTEISSMRDIILHLKGDNKFMQISECHPCYLPLHYVLMFPYGELGWEPDFKKWDVSNDEPLSVRMTQVEYYSYRLFQRHTEYSTILRGGSLFQEFLVDAWASTEQNRLNYIKHNQSKLRVEVYGDLTNANVKGLLPSDVGKRLILPSSFTGSARNMHEIYQDSMAITRYNQHPDIFLTMTANPKWPEIVSALLPHQDIYDRPDLVVRVFELKKIHLLKVIKEKNVFGRQVARVYTIEFQKRGLPHMHVLIFLAGPDKIRTSLQVDNLVCAEFPDPDDDPILFETVKNCMVHGPCGSRNDKARCMDKNKCTKKYPRDFVETTTMDQDGYPIYRRRDNGRVFKVRGVNMDNRDVVPYNPYLSKMFDCHINVEVCAGIRCVKYIHKYIYKGHDRATMVLGEDEVKQYLDSRYIGPHEAAWRIFRYPLHEESPTVVRLHLHLPGEHQVVYDEDDEMDSVIESASIQKSTLTGFFECCTKNVCARKFTYQEFPQHFVWNKKEKIWTLRKMGLAIGRLYFASPNCGERFYLRLLLTVVKGPLSFKCLRTFNGQLLDTFKLACSARGLLEDDSEWVQCLKEASDMQTGYQLRRLFSVILTQCHPLHPNELWRDFSVHICDDLAHKIRTSYDIPDPTENEVEDYGLYLINELLMESGKTLSDFPPMPKSIGNWSLVVENRLIREHLQLQREAKEKDADINVDRLNSAQRRAYDKIVDSVFNSKGVTFFLNGGAGTGKTFLYNTISTKCRSLDYFVINVASSGIASLLLIGGRTAHSTFSIPLNIVEDSICHISKQSLQAELIRKTSLIIWDEVPMQHRNCVEAVNRTLQDIHKNEKPFGGITVVLGGDFRQILPVVPKGVREQIVGASLRRSILWRKIHVLTLDVNMRLNDSISGNSDFAHFLLKIGSNSEELMEIPTTMCKCTNLNNLISTTYPNLHDHEIVTNTYLNERTILSARNDDVSEINNLALKIFPGIQKTYLAADKMVEEDQVDKSITSRYPNEYLNSLNPSGLPPFKLELKVGAPIMLLRNIAPKDGLCNGTRLMVVRCSTRVIEARILNGDKSGNLVFIPRISLTPSDSEIPFVMTRRQFLVRLAYAMTINKSQGQSVKFVGIDLRTPVFSHGQLYVALSRCTSYDRISVLLPDGEQTTTNIVYPEVLI